MKRRILATLVCLCLLVGMMPTVALAAEEGTKENPWDISAEGEGNNVYAYLMSNETMEATYGDVISLSTSPNSTYTLHIEGTGAMKDFTGSPDMQPWAGHRTQITQLVVEEGITYLGNRAFQNCSGIETVSLPDSLTKLGTHVFKSCSSITELNLKNITELGKEAIYGCSALTSLTMPESLSEIPVSAFGGLTSMTSDITIPNGVSNIGNGAFSSWAQNAQHGVSIQWSDNISVIGDSVFSNAKLTGELVIPSSVTEIGRQAFQNSNNSAQYVAITSLTFAEGSQCKKIGDSAFYQITSLTGKLSIPASVKEIGKLAFRGTAITGLTFDADSNLETISEQAFFQVDKLCGTIVIPDSVTSIGKSAFNSCGIEGITITSNSRLKSIGEGAFAGCNSLTGEIYIPAGVTEVSKSAFSKSSGQTAIDKIIFAKGVGTIGENAFAGTNVESIEFSTTITTIQEKGFYGASAPVIILPDGITSIGGSAFYRGYDQKTHSLFVPSSVTKIENLALDCMTQGSIVYYSGANSIDNLIANQKKSALAITNGGTFAGDTEFTSGTLATPIKDGYIFAGWYANSDFTGEALTSATAGQTYYAKWTEDDAEGGTPSTTGDKNDNGTTQGTIETELSDGMESSGQTDAETDEVIDEIDNTPVNSLPAGDTTDNEPAEEKSVKEVPAPVEPTLITPSAMGCASASTMSLTYMAPGDGSDGDDDTVYSFYVGEELLGRTGTGETVLTYDTAQKDLQIGKNTVEVYTGESKTGEPTATITVNLKQKPVTVTGLTAEDRYYNGSTDITLTGGKLTGIEGTDNVSFAATGTVADASAGTNKPVTATVVLSGTDAGWYTATASGVTVDIYETSGGGGGGGSSSPSYAITVDSGKHGDVTVNRSRATKGSTVTITVDPDAGYELDTLVVTDKNGNEIKLTDKGNGKYTFKMPGSQVTVEAAFAKINEQPSTGFVDVPANAYYADAVKWAVENGVTEGTSATTFSPDMSCTRAQMVTFLWRAAGSPAPKSTVNPFTDIQPDTYYYDAVLWAAEQGITSGTSATTFAPDATVTRGQTVTFLWRYDGSPVVSSGSFADVPADAYYASAVAWAVSEGVTNGTSATTFSPDANCTRAQIVTFLWRELA